MPHEVAAIVQAAKGCGAPLGIHAHNDMELAVANTLAAVRAGAAHVQGMVMENGVAMPISAPYSLP